MYRLEGRQVIKYNLTKTTPCFGDYASGRNNNLRFFKSWQAYFAWQMQVYLQTDIFPILKRGCAPSFTSGASKYSPILE